MPVILTNQTDLTDVDLAYGNNILSLFQSVGNNRTVCRILNKENDELLADLRQLPNSVGYAHYDISRILQSQVAKGPTQGDTSISTVRLFTNPYECFSYYVEVGSQSTAGIVTIDATYSGSVVDDYLSIPGRNVYANPNGVPNWADYTDYIPTVSTFAGDPVSTLVGDYQLALTDRHYTTINSNDITDGKPNTWPNPQDVYRISVGKDIQQDTEGDDYSLQFLNRWEGTAPDYYNGINYLRCVVYNGNTELVNTTIQNTISNGGGPNVNFDQEIPPLGQYSMIGAKTGYNNADIAVADVTHYYIWVEAQADEDMTINDGIRISYVYRFDVDDSECNDYDVVQVRWLNSLGGTDYFSFRKKNTETTQITRNTYRQTNQTYGDQSWRSYPYDRGERVFNQEITTNHTADTRWLTDDESTYLRNLYMSPSVEVKFGYDAANWTPVVLTSNTFTEKTYRKDKMFQHSISFKDANNINAQGG